MHVTFTAPPVSVGKFLRSLRIEQGITSVKDAAKTVGCGNVHNYSNIENGNRIITPEKLLEYTTKILAGNTNEALNRILAWAMHMHDDEGRVQRD